MRKHLFTILLTVFCVCYASAQTTVTGVVKDDTGETLPGASVIIKGTAKGTITDLNGKFSLSVANLSTAVLKVSYIGMKNLEMPLKGGQTKDLQIQLESNSNQLDEMVVIGYGSVKKKDLTGSVTTIKGESLIKVPVSNVAEALTGKIAGVRMTTTDGSPDAEVLIRVRGGGSITGDNSPLYVVDGFPVDKINDIPTNDIEDITVLRDASSTAIYGSRGANGVILITTKKSDGGASRVNYNSFYTVKSVAKRLKPMNTYDYVMSNYEYALLKNSTSNFFQSFGVYDDLDIYKNVNPIDWQSDMFGANVLTQQQNVSVTGGSKTTNFSVSGTYDYNGGLMVNNDYSRYAFQFKLNHELSKNLKMGFNARISDQTVNGSGTQGGTYKVRSSQAVTSVATRGLSDFITVDTSAMTDEELQQYLQNTMSLSEQAQQYWKRTNNRSFNFNGSLDWLIVKGLTAHGEAGYGYGFNEAKNWWSATTTNASYVGGMPLADWTKTNASNYREAVTLTYDLKVLNDHHFNVMAGQELSSIMSNNTYMYGTMYSKAYEAEKVFANFGSGTGVVTEKSTISPAENLKSYFGRFNYSFKDKYLLALTMREDGSSKFGVGHQYSFYPGVAGGWRILDEPFMESAKKVLSNLKLRLSYGEAGNNRIPNISYKMTYAPNMGTKRYGVGEIANNDYSAANSFLSNPYLEWERAINRDLGLDFGFLDERINGTLDLYSNTTKKLLIPHTITAPGYTSVYENTAQTTNQGIELSINASIVRKKNFTLDANFNIGFNQSKVDALSNGLESMSFASGWAGTDNKNQEDYIVKVGQPIGQIYGWVSDGYYTTNDFDSYDAAKKAYVLKAGVASTGLLGGAIGIRPGTMKLRDISGPNGVADGIVDSYDRVVIGDTNPLFQGGFGLNSSCYGFDLNANFTFTVGNDIYNANKIGTTQQYRSGTYPNMLDIMNQRNSYSYMNPATGQLMTSLADLAAYNEGANAKQYWSPYSVGNTTVVPTSWAIEDGSFLRLQSLTIGYTLPKKVIAKLKIQNLRVYTTATNLFILTNYSGFDPEISSSVRNSSYSNLTPGIDYSSYPKSRGYTFGLNISF
ncbi:MAG: TonB-dependent receptor [Paludibacter sp.]|nr:TonB-dependent receptor [Paludibacter sp.]